MESYSTKKFLFSQFQRWYWELYVSFSQVWQEPCDMGGIIPVFLRNDVSEASNG